ncbi:MAG: 4-phosphoerythronate dehydrogenase PdxB [Bacteroidales bacterium]|nr:4-phosphoerythronate dehydrogenase PdxB [Bacteroidales bacterium]
MKIIADDKIPFLKGVLEPFADIVYKPGHTIEKDDLLDADALIVRTRTQCNSNLLEGTGVKFVATATIGYDHIDTDYCKKNNIYWANAPGCNAGSVMQWFMAALLQYAYQNKIDLTTRCLGVIGVGNVGSKIVSFAENTGMRVLLNDPPKADLTGSCGFLNLETIMRESDIISFHVPLTPDGKHKTLGMAGENFLQKLTKGTILINSSRGEVVDTQALKNTLINNRLSAALIDVWENEPAIDLELLKMCSVATPHIAGYSLDGKAKGTAMSVSALSRYFGLPLIDWYPDEIPTREIMEITIDARKRSYQSVLTEAVLHTYDIISDDSALRLNPAGFEDQRGNYPVRREFNAWIINLKNDSRNYKQRLRQMGFTVLG